MNGTSETYPAQAQPRDRSWSSKAVAGGGVAEALGGIAVIVLAIVSLARIIPVELAAIASIVLGAAFFCEG